MGVSGGTWLLIFCELSCWMSFGFYKSDPRLIILGCTGVTASILMLSRIAATRVATRDLAAYQRLRDEELATLPGVHRLSSTIVMKRIVDERPLPL